MRNTITDLTPASGRQDHTALPYAITPFVRTLSRALVLPHPPHPIPTFVTMANAPLLGQDGAE
jgi:hypothetical protein